MAKGITTAVVMMAMGALCNADDGQQKKPKPAEVMKPALIVMDVQNKFLPMMAKEDQQIGIEMINAAIHLFRKNGFPIIRVYHSHPEYGPMPGSEDFEFPATIQVKPEDAQVIKAFPSAFRDTELETLLHQKGCNTVYITGLSAVGCALATYFGAQERNFNTFMVKYALMSHKAEYTDFIEEITDAMGYDALRIIIEMAAQLKR